MKRLTLDVFIKRANEVHNFKYDYSKSDYTYFGEKVIIICKEHGEFKQVASSHLNSNGCPKCAGKYQPTAEEYIEKAKLIHGDRYDYSKCNYVNISTKVTIICKKHGAFEQNPRSHLKNINCIKCSYNISKKETKWLDSLNVPNEFRNKIVRINNKRMNPDAIDEENKIIYEFNGDFWHGNPKIYDKNRLNKMTKTTFGELYQETLDKENFVKQAGYKVISIWESDWDTIEQNEKL